MSARVTLTADLRAEPWLRLVPTVGGQVTEMNRAVDTAAGDVEVSLGITLVTPLLCAAGTIRTTIALGDGESVVVDFLPYSEPWRTLVSGLVPDCT
jgi:hypothetical protein